MIDAVHPGAAPDGETRLLTFANLSRPIAFLDSWPVAEILLRLLRGWPLVTDRPASAPPAITVRHEGGLYRVDCGWSGGARDLADPIDAACALIAELIQALLAEQNKRLCLHSAAVEIDGRLVLFPSDYRAGKSTFVAALAARGARIFSDDVLPLTADRGFGIAPGLSPRLRRPLPNDMSAGLRAFVDRHRGPTSTRYRYLDLGPMHLAAFGEVAPIGAFVLLEREARAEAQLLETSAADVLRRLVLRNFARSLPASVILARLHELVEIGPRLRLRYARAEEGADLLLCVAKSWHGEPAYRRRMASPSPRPLAAARLAAVPPGCFLRHPAVSETTVDQEAFLTDPTGWSIHYLNPLGTALWRLFSQPMSIADATEILHAAFPERSRTQLAKDVVQWVLQVRAQGFLLSGDDPVAPDDEIVQRCAG
ncbi:MAG: PqqD family protein [Rhodospirillaceae bacterium]|nr:PqqD family protein [Rhodospirillaceae bacterium]